MTERRAAVIAVGGLGRVHAHAWQRIPGVRLVAVADRDPEAARWYAVAHGIAAYQDFAELIRTERPDYLSIAAPPALRLAAVELAVEHGVRAIHCEKPMAMTFGDAVRMVELTRAAGVRFSVNHTRRLNHVQRAVRDVVRSGVIGATVSVEAYCPNLFDYGSHLVDLVFFHRGDLPAESVLAAVDVRTDKRVYGAPTETDGLVHLRFPDGVAAIVVTGREPDPLMPRGNAGIVIHGTTGSIDVFDNVAHVRTPEGVTEIRNRVDPQFEIDVWGVTNAPIIEGTCLAIEQLADESRALDLDASQALRAAEVVFAAYESSVRRERVPMPLDATDNALVRGLEQGLWRPVGTFVSTM